MLKMQIIGNLGKDCIVNNVNGRNVMNFTVAHTEKFKDSQGNNQERTTWVDCAWWSDRTNISQYLTKGQKVWIDGTPEVRSYTRNDGTPGAVLALRVRELQLVGSRTDTASSGAFSSNTPAAPQTDNTPEATGAAEVADDLPF